MKDDMEIRILAVASGLTELPAEFYPGIRFNLDLLRSYGALVEGLELSDRLEPAFEYEP